MLKIGWSGQVEVRNHSIATGFPFDLVDYKIIAEIPGMSQRLEGQFHLFMERYRSHSEYYFDTTASRSAIRDWLSRTKTNVYGFTVNFLAKL